MTWSSINEISALIQRLSAQRGMRAWSRWSFSIDIDTFRADGGNEPGNRDFHEFSPTNFFLLL